MSLTLFSANAFSAILIGALATLGANVLTGVMSLTLIKAYRLVALCISALAALITHAFAYVVGIVTVALVGAEYFLAGFVSASAANLTSVLTRRNSNVSIGKNGYAGTNGVDLRIPFTVCN